MDIPSNRLSTGLRWKDALIKRTFDIIASFTGLLITSPLIIFAWLIASIETKSNGFFVQKRIGRHGKPFYIIKIKTMYPSDEMGSSVTTENDIRITKSGKVFRRTKSDELPQLFNILIGQMSFVGPRPDVPGFADTLSKDEQLILTVRPGITGPATIKYKNEESVLEQQSDPESYNRDIIFPDKVRININYIHHYSFIKDIDYIWRTIFN